MGCATRSTQPSNAFVPDPVLSIKDLAVEFHTDDGIVHAVNGITYEVFPGLTIVLVVLCINFVGDGLRDALDPTQQRVRA